MHSYASPSRSEIATVPQRMTEVVLSGIVEPSGLQLSTRDIPTLRTGECLVAVAATGVSFAEQAMRRGRYPGQPAFPFVPGYDVVGTVLAVADGDGDSSLIGRPVAALTKTRGWADHVVLPVDDLVIIPDGLDPAEAETFVVNGLTGWQLLHRAARVRPGATILVSGANGGVGTTLAQLARLHGVRVIGVARPQHHDELRGLGVEPVDPGDSALLADRIRELAPAGVDAAFDNLGGENLRRYWDLLAPGGTLVNYSIASITSGNLVLHFVAMLARLAWWNALPNGKRAMFYDVWAGHRRRPTAFRNRLRHDLVAVLQLLAEGKLSAKIAARLPLTEAAAAMELAESRSTLGKVVLMP